MEENDNGQDKQKGDDVTDEPMAQGIETMQKKFRHPVPLIAQPAGFAPNHLGCLCGNLRQEGGSFISCVMVNGNSVVRGT